MAGRSPFPAGTGRRLALSRAALYWERLWPALWPLLAIGLGFAAIASFDLLPALPAPVHAAILLVLAAAIGAAARSAVRSLALPGHAEARRRLEESSGLPHRPLEALEDRPVAVADDPFAAALWAAHRERMAAAAGRLRLAWPRAGLLERDPYGLRAGLSLLLLIGIIAAGNDFWPRLGRALAPQLGTTAPALAPSFDLWVTPPDYTRLPPIYLGDAAATGTLAPSADKPVAVPIGSTLLAQVHGGRSAPRLALDDKTEPFQTLGNGDFSATAKFGEAHSLTIVQDGARLARYAISIVPDQPPSASWASPVRATPRGALRLDYAAKDDYGVKSLTLEVRRDGSQEPPLLLALPTPPEGKEVRSTVYQDLTAHPWAGLPVQLTLIARDAIGQSGASAPIRMTLPERVFRNAVARAIIAQRKRLIRRPEVASEVAQELSDISVQPDGYRDDPLVFLALRAAVDRLDLDRGHGETASVAQLLWDTALRIEEGNEPQAEKTLREAEQALQDALDRNAPPAEIDRLMAELQQAIGGYLQAMVETMQRNGGTPPMPGVTGNAVTAQDIQKMFDQARKMAQSGARDAAKNALAQLQDLLESLRAGAPPTAAQAQAQQMMRGLQDLAQRQQQLLDQSYRQAQRGREGTSPAPGQPGSAGRAGNAPGGDLAGAQEGLRRQLGELMRQLGENGEIPQAFGRAERSMHGAAEALQRGSPGDAVGPQGEALDQLQQAERELAQQMQQNGEGGPQQAGSDPFGRNGNGPIDGGDVKIPTASEMQRSRAILDELRRRAGDRARPPLEHDYIDRLLQRF